MSSPFIGQVLVFGGNFPPRGWMSCNGQLLPISQYDTLFALIGTTYGGDGQTTFGLPNLQSRFPVSQGMLAGGGTYTMGQQGGAESVTVLQAQMPAHTHPVACNSAAGTSADPTGNIFALAPNLDPYSGTPTGAAMKSNAVGMSPASGGQPHDNMIPYQTLNYVIAVEGIFPSRN